MPFAWSTVPIANDNNNNYYILFIVCGDGTKAHARTCHTISGQYAWTQLLLFFKNYSSILCCQCCCCYCCIIILSSVARCSDVPMLLCPHKIVYIQLLVYVTWCVREFLCVPVCVCTMHILHYNITRSRWRWCCVAVVIVGASSSLSTSVEQIENMFT